MTQNTSPSGGTDPGSTGGPEAHGYSYAADGAGSPGDPGSAGSTGSPGSPAPQSPLSPAADSADASTRPGAPSSPGPIPGTGSGPGATPGTAPFAAPGHPSAPFAAPGHPSAWDPAPGIVAENVSRAFGAVRAVDGLSLTAPRGAVTALVGPNGCGKSTLMLMLASLLAPDSGRVLVNGVDPSVDSPAVRASVGWMPDQFGAWDSLRVSEVLDVVGRSYFLPSAQRRQRVDELLELMDLVPLAQQPAHVLSRGQKQRLGLARALVHNPSVLILDEPASGLDPASRRRLLRVVRSLAATGTTVLISSHILTELEEMADHVVFLDAGRTVDSASIRDLAARPRPWRISSLDAARLTAALSALGAHHGEVLGPERTTSGHAEVIVQLPDEATAARLLTDLAAEGAPIIGFGPATGRLEAAYLASDAAHREGAL